jgi:protein-S-isoprenylcysteine O-methyltransferase Ste14
VSTDSPVRGAAVRFRLPPLLYAVPLAATLAVHHWLLPWSIPGGPAVTVLGAVLTVLGLGFSLSGAATVLAHRTTLAPHHPVARLVTSGPFRISRNPMYTGLTVAYVGAALWAGTWWPLPFAPLVAAAVLKLVIEPEEAYLTERFGAGFTRYRDRVRRWL